MIIEQTRLFGTQEYALWQYRLWSFQGRYTKLERFLVKFVYPSLEISTTGIAIVCTSCASLRRAYDSKLVTKAKLLIRKTNQCGFIFLIQSGSLPKTSLFCHRIRIFIKASQPYLPHSGFELWFREKKSTWHMTFTQS